ncbi:MAG: hypothetical protein N3A66_01580 [Planctomycetota bacterium]|nr:hypothetical protein [Planctomycetota bacterium]
MATASSPKTAKPSALREALADLDKAYPGAPATDLDFFVMAILGDATPERMAAFRRLREGFVEWNEARVARLVELARLLDPLPEADALAFRLRTTLNKLFDLRGAMDLTFLVDMRLSDARRKICGLDKSFTRQTADQILSAVTSTVSPPLSAAALQAARKHGILPAGKNARWLQQRLQEDLAPAEAARLVFLLTLSAATKRQGATGRKSQKKGKSLAKKARKGGK